MEMTVELFDSIINTSQDCVFWKDKNRRFIGVNKAFLDFYGFECEASDINLLMTEDVVMEGSIENIKNIAPIFGTALKENGFGSVLIARVRNHDDVKGYLICAVQRNHRIWQEYESAMLYYVAGLMV